MEGTIFNIQRFSIHDGPGIRTTVFLKGCNLRCFWCHNPESWSALPQIQHFPQKCISCGKCLSVCPRKAHQVQAEGRKVFDRAVCRACGTCATNCYSGALALTGKRMTVEEVVAEAEKDRLFYENSGGGVTFSGGEPLLQKEFLREALVECRRRGLHTAVDTAGNVPQDSFREILPHTCLFLFDMKAADPEKHKKATGVSNKRILDNLRQLAATAREQNSPSPCGEGVAPAASPAATPAATRAATSAADAGSFQIWVRIPVIPGLNDDTQEMMAMADILQNIPGIAKVELLPFHRLAAGKYESLDMEYLAREMEAPLPEQVEEWKQLFREKGIQV